MEAPIAAQGQPLAGRGQELGQLRAALVGAAGGAGHLVLLTGEPGIGKTRLAAAVTEMAGEYGVPVAAGHAIDDPGMPPLWPWRGVSRSVPALAAALPDAPAVALAGLADPAASVDSASARFVMFATACQALATDGPARAGRSRAGAVRSQRGPRRADRHALAAIGAAGLGGALPALGLRGGPVGGGVARLRRGGPLRCLGPAGRRSG
jgi:hypothetical protein